MKRALSMPLPDPQITAAIVGAVLGALLSGGVGIGAALYIHWREINTRKRVFLSAILSEVENLVDMVENIPQDSPRTTSDHFLIMGLSQNTSVFDADPTEVGVLGRKIASDVIAFYALLKLRILVWKLNLEETEAGGAGNVDVSDKLREAAQFGRQLVNELRPLSK